MTARSLTVWVTPFTTLSSLEQAIATVRQLSAKAGRGWSPNLLLPTHFGKWPQRQCRQTLPADMLVASADDVTWIRGKVEAAGIGFGCWGVPVDQGGAAIARDMALAGGYYVANFEPDQFWLPGDDPAAIDAWWTEYWDSSYMDPLSGNTAATVVPNGWGLGAFKTSLGNLAAGCGALTLEVYGGLQTASSYPSPNLWPLDGFAEVRAAGVDANLVPILAQLNLSTQIALANRLGHGNVHVWAI